MKNDNYITIMGFMLNQLKLRGNELIVYATIYGFCQGGQGKFIGSTRYLAESLGVRQATIVNILNGLVAKGLLIKTEISGIGAVKKCEYTIPTDTETVSATDTETVSATDTETVSAQCNTSNNNNNIYNPPYNNPPNNDACVSPDYESDFEEFWKSYTPVMTKDGNVPKGPKKIAKERYIRARKKGATHADIIDGAKKYLEHCAQCGIYSCQVAVFLSQERWRDDYSSQVILGLDRKTRENLEREIKMQELIRQSRIEAGLE